MVRSVDAEAVGYQGGKASDDAVPVIPRSAPK